MPNKIFMKCIVKTVIWFRLGYCATRFSVSIAIETIFYEVNPQACSPQIMTIGLNCLIWIISVYLDNYEAEWCRDF